MAVITYREALRTAMAHNRDGTTGRASHVVLPTELVVRDSTAPPPTS